MNSNLDREAAMEKFLAGYNCSQAVLYSACGRLQLDKDIALKTACGLGAGIARSQQICGAVSGGILALGLKHGRGVNDDRTRTEDTYARARAFMAAFTERHGSVNCRELTKCDLTTPEGRQYFKENDLLHGVCARCVESAIELLEKEL